MEESTAEQPSGRKRSDLAKAFAARLRNSGENGNFGGRVVTAGIAVVVAGALAVGIGALIYHKARPPKTVNAADAQRSPTSLRTTVITPSLVPQPPHTSPPQVSPGGGGKKPGANAKRPNAGGKASAKAMHADAVHAAAVPVHTIVSFASGRCIDVTNEGQTGIPLQIWDCGPVVDWKKWAFFPDNTIRSMGKCMTLAGGSADGTPIELEPCNGGASQRFVLNTSWDLVNIAADKCVDVKDKQTANGTPLQLWQCAGTSNQKWRQG